MKKIRYAICLMALLLCACSEDEVERTPEGDFLPDNKPTIENTLKFEAKELMFTPQKTSGSIHIKANIEYIIELKNENEDWIKYDTNSNNYISFEVRPNNSENERYAKCIIFNKELKVSDTLHIKQTVNKERFALIKIYNALNGKNWTYQNNWCSDRPLREWEGITATEDYEVKMIQLSNDAYIEGIIPAEIGLLSNLQTLFIYNTNVSGRIPSEIGNLPKLKYLDLPQNKLSGTIPSDLQKCKSLEYINIKDNNFNGPVPGFLFNMPNLVSLYGGNNNFTKIEIGNNSNCNISIISLENNNIKGELPPNIFNIKINEIYLNNNKITGHIPNEIINSINLKTLELQNNELTGVLPDLSDKSLLQNFKIYQNNITGSIPNSYANVFNLSLQLYNNNMSGIISDEVKQHNKFYEWSINPQKEGYELIY